MNYQKSVTFRLSIWMDIHKWYNILYNALRGKTLQCFSHRYNVARLILFSLYFQGKCSYDLQSSVILVQIFKGRIHHATSTESIQLPFKWKKKIPLRQHFSKNSHFVHPWTPLQSWPLQWLFFLLILSYHFLFH